MPHVAVVRAGIPVATGHTHQSVDSQCLADSEAIEPSITICAVQGLLATATTRAVVFGSCDAVQHRCDRDLSLSLMRESGIAPIVRGEVIE